MSMSGRTQFFALKTYQLGDTVNFMPDFNDDMAIIDAQMHANQQAAQDANTGLETVNTALTNMQNEIDEVRASVQPLEAYDVIYPVRNTQQVKLTDIKAAIIKNGRGIYFASTILLTNYILPVDFDLQVVVGQRLLIPMIYVTGNPLNLNEGASSYVTISGGTILFIRKADQATPESAPFPVTIWYEGGRTHIGWNFASADTNRYGRFSMNGLINKELDHIVS